MPVISLSIINLSSKLIRYPLTQPTSSIVCGAFWRTYFLINIIWKEFIALVLFGSGNSNGLPFKYSDSKSFILPNL